MEQINYEELENYIRQLYYQLKTQQVNITEVEPEKGAHYKIHDGGQIKTTNKIYLKVKAKTPSQNLLRTLKLCDCTQVDNLIEKECPHRKNKEIKFGFQIDINRNKHQAQAPETSLYFIYPNYDYEIEEKIRTYLHNHIENTIDYLNKEKRGLLKNL